ncbi:MAG: hypothetical protein IKG47_03975 [Oscillospiraceae bacterium]|nr:hypothetical protein [Oscillospiraceae bacterium]
MLDLERKAEWDSGKNFSERKSCTSGKIGRNSPQYCGHLEKIVFENKKRIVCDDDSNFLGGASKARVYVHKGRELIDFRVRP